MQLENLRNILKKVSTCMMHLDDQGQKEKYPVSLLDMQCWEWPQGVGLLGLVKYALAHNDQEVLDFVEKWYDDHMEMAQTIERNVNSTSPMLGLTYLYEVKPKPEYLALIKSWADWVMDHNGLIRTGDGLMQHMITGDPNPDQILIDTLFMTVLFLLRASKLLGKQEMLSEANYQILSHIRYLFDVRCGLFYHGWSFKEMSHYGGVHWLRGNSWYTVVCMDLIFEQETIPDEVRRVCISTLSRQAQALKRYQDTREGLWHTVIDNSSSYIEISGCAASLCGIMKAVRTGLLPKEEYINLIQTGVRNIFRYIDEDGAVRNVSYGTPIGMDEQFYLDIPCLKMTYGQAMMILMVQECMDPFWENL